MTTTIFVSSCIWVADPCSSMVMWVACLPSQTCVALHTKFDFYILPVWRSPLSSSVHTPPLRDSTPLHTQPLAIYTPVKPHCGRLECRRHDPSIVFSYLASSTAVVMPSSVLCPAMTFILWWSAGQPVSRRVITTHDVCTVVCVRGLSSLKVRSSSNVAKLISVDKR